MRETGLYFKGRGRYSAAEFCAFWEWLWDTIWGRHYGDGASACRTGVEARLEVAPNVVFRGADLLVRRQGSEQPVALEFSCYGNTAVLVSADIRVVEAEVVWDAAQGPKLTVNLAIEKADGFVVRGSLVYYVRANAVARRRIVAELKERFRSQAPVASHVV